ncbi:hypothetical protein [Kocuria rosea]|uniref:hypothetical protein n=1 Tax=Kocuria rosea TaxID=1275 RepID=UPI00203BC268|nr:hypothetical protein [Kocuria rosea]MCM3688575.1 hypothetical protein [Kocuria rosea]
MTTAPVSALLGSAARAPFVVLKRFRPHRPIHPEGTGLDGTLTRTGGGDSGIRWIDEPGQEPVRARFSRSAGLPHGWPDILGLALRVPVPAGEGAGGDAEGHDGRADVLLATAGSGRLSRFVPTLHRYVPDGAFASFMPYRGTHGPVLVAVRSEPRAEPLPARPDRFREAVAAEPWVLGLYWATPLGPWRRFGTAELQAGAPVDHTERFDPLLNVPVGAENYGWTHRLREPSYSLARRPREELGRA